ncbi:hypothetical protein F53441_13363 [Fusarium austroafricanum]|uniref:Uncharacterized protein n=1 Tax=Fusarium austroafricanum TaxID=2364996 RepID=A0A8H4JPF7_9HYPO|nr:hypothetical protein F53441_13363 [Fusarium austroafricanum]
MVYFESEAVPSCSVRSIAYYFFREWLHLHNGRPIFQRDSFSAAPAKIIKNSPGNLKQLSAYHHDFCEQLSMWQDDLVDFYAYERSQGSEPDISQRTKEAEFSPVHSTNIGSRLDHGYIMRHLFRALYVIVNGQAMADDTQPSPPQLEHEDCHLYKEAEADRKMSRFVRARLNTAVRFVWDLLRCEEMAFEEVEQLEVKLRDEQEALSYQRALARANNEAFEEDQVWPEWERVRRWTFGVESSFTWSAAWAVKSSDYNGILVESECLGTGSVVVEVQIEHIRAVAKRLEVREAKTI